MRFGLHCSIRAGYSAALAEAESLGCGAMQMFSYRRHHEPAPDELSTFREARRAGTVARLYIHARFLPFLASADAARREHSIGLLVRELRLAGTLGADGLIVHAGAYAQGEDARTGLKRFASGAAEAVSRAGRPANLIVENVPGGGRRMGGSLEELAALGDLLAGAFPEAGFCLDTAHAWAYGYDLSSREGMWKFLGLAHRLLGADRVKVFHLNDSRALLGSHREHHWHWGQGYLGTQGLKALLEREEYAGTAGILETPKGEFDRANLDLVRDLASA